MLRKLGEIPAILGLWLVCTFNLFYFFQSETLLLTSEILRQPWNLSQSVRDGEIF